MWAIEEIKVRQRARDRNILEGDRNTTYFYAVANQRARKKRIEGLQSDHGLVQDTPGILKIAVQYYKELFGWESREPFCLADNFWDACDLVFSEENSSLESPFREKEIKEVVFSCYAEGAPGPDGLSFSFYHEFWEAIKWDIVRMFVDFYYGKLDLFRLNLLS
jgi:hypothetical protein